MSVKVPMTAQGAENLKAELEQLKSVERPAVIQAISEARAHGDLKENAEYHAAKEQQGFIEARIRDIEGKLANAQIVDISNLPNEGRVVFGSQVTLINTDTEVTVVYQIVGDDEADLRKNKISFSSPIARSVIGKHKEEEVIVNTPNGEVVYFIEQVSYIVEE